jgi:hypothetical protein
LLQIYLKAGLGALGLGIVGAKRGVFMHYCLLMGGIIFVQDLNWEASVHNFKICDQETFRSALIKTA